jgi:hypothetical protein
MSVRAVWSHVSASFSGQAEAVDVSARGATVTPTDRAARNHAVGNVVDLVDGERPRELAGEDPRSRRLRGR